MTTLRAAVPPDARAIAEVHVRSWQSAYLGLMPSETLNGLSVDAREQAWRERLAAPADGRVILVAEAEPERVGGFVSFGPTDDAGDAGAADDAGDAEAPQQAGEIYALYVDPADWGSGVGRALLQAATEALALTGFRSATLWVLETNERARRFYEAAGWSWDGSRSSHQVECANMPIVRYAASL